ncbi:MAG: type II secretion system GspH family protein [Phycisphaerales bacterium]|nr:type II secretion system GspH family protein [Phycisphaerales bacterium]
MQTDGRGFTLIEVLIVTVLAAAMGISAKSLKAKAQAACTVGAGGSSTSCPAGWTPRRDRRGTTDRSWCACRDPECIQAVG